MILTERKTNDSMPNMWWEELEILLERIAFRIYLKYDCTLFPIKRMLMISERFQRFSY